MSSSEDDEEDKTRFKFNGTKPEKRESFEKRILRKLARKTGRALAERMWANEIPDLTDAGKANDEYVREHAKLVLKKVRASSESRAAKYEKATHIVLRRKRLYAYIDYIPNRI